MTFRRIVLLLFLLLMPLFVVWADEYDDISKQLNDLNSALNSSRSATQTNEKELTKLQTQLQAIKNQVIYLESEIVKKEKEVADGEKVLVYQKTLLDQRAISYYKNIAKNSIGVVDILVSEDIASSLQNFFYQKTLQDEDRRTITKIVMYIKNLEEKKNSLVSENKKMVAIKLEVDKQSQFLAGEVSKAKKYEGELQNKIAALSVRQQEIIAQKQGTLNLPKSAGSSAHGCVDDRDIDPGFSPRLAFFTFGVPNRTGLNQYGAKGRAEAGQNYETILRAYYNFDEFRDWDTNTNINVDGYGSYSLDEYVKRIYEVPESWPMESLKAQAVAARSYVLAYTNNGQGSICTTEYCQVFKPDPKGGAWSQAVDDTKGKVMIQGGNPIKAWFSSTHGGYVFSTGQIGWSSTGWTKNAQDASSGIGSFSDLMANAYDRSSPWFYCDWGARAAYNKTAWLKTSEVADIVNILLLVKRDSGTSIHLYQTDSANPAGSETWDAERVKSELRSRGGNPFSNITDVSVSADFGSGRTSSVTLSGDAGSANFSGSEFKDWFNLRAPANIQIVGPLFNVEKR